MPYKDKARKMNPWRATVTVNGQRFTQCFQTKQEAKNWENETKKSVKKRLKKQQTGMDLLTLCNKYLDYSVKFSKETYNFKKMVYQRFIAYMGPDTYIDEITTEHVEKYLYLQRETRTAYATNKDRKELNALWNKGMKTYGVQYNPVEKTEKFPHHRTPPYCPPVKDVLRILAVATRKEKVLLDCYLHTGARKSEIFKLKWNDVDLLKRTIRIGTMKTHGGSMKYRLLDLSDELFESLSWWWENRPVKESEYVFCHDSKGGNHGKRYVRRQKFLSRLSKKAGVKPFGYHGLRRFVASLLDNQRVPIRDIQKVLGHSKPTTTDLYIRDINSSMKDTMNKLSLREIHRDDTPDEKRAINEDR